MITHRDNCRGCFSKNLTQVLDLGEMPLAGGFLTEEQIPSETKFPLRVNFCNTCGLVQVSDIVDPGTLFKDYFFVASVIPSLVEHFKRYAEFLRVTYLVKEDAKLLEFGSNDGVLLQNFINDPNIKTLGIDPSKNVTDIARKKGLDIIMGYFTQGTAKEILEKYGQMDVVTGSNVFAHIDDIHELIKAAKIVLKPSGVFVVEVHYVGDIIKDFQYDSIYHEHLCYYSVTALENIFGLEGMKIINVEHLTMHGGGVRVVVALKENPIGQELSVALFLNEEKKNGINSVQPFLELGEQARVHKEKVLTLLHSLKKQNKRIVGYGAPGRGTILLNYCGIDMDLLDYIVDVSPLRVGHLMPGVHIPIFYPQKARENPPDYFFVLAWDYTESIMAQEKDLVERGVKFIIPFPSVRIM